MLKHPAALAWDKWKARNPDLFRGDAGGIYLENRIRTAFEEDGWERAAKAVTSALETPVDSEAP